MLISPSTTNALDEIASRAADVLSAYRPGAIPTHSDVYTQAGSRFSFDPLSATAPPNAYFVSESSSMQRSYSRDGTFHLQSGLLVNRNGEPVLGYRNDRSSPAPLRCDAAEVALGRTAGLRIEPDGSITYDRVVVDPRTRRGNKVAVSIGRLALARFSAATKLQTLDATRFLAPPGIVPHIGRATDGNFDAVAPNTQETSAIDLDLGLQRLQEAYLAFDALRAAHSAQGGIDKTTMDLLK
ncbi:MAG: hypothetical protein M3Y21_05420 [Candidatus Eremiobacteraeota bacterium]|nr:hypothetical protein [Candidatus Eremiobacteraeota bacterium]